MLCNLNPVYFNFCRVDEATALLQISTNNQLDSIIRSLNGVCFAMPFLFPNTDYIHDFSTNNDSVNNNSDICDETNLSFLVNRCSKQSIIRPVDFPSNVVQVSLLVFFLTSNYSLLFIVISSVGCCCYSTI